MSYFTQHLVVSRYKSLLLSSAIELFTNYATICFFIFTYISHILPILTYMHLLDFSKKVCFFNLEPFAVCKKSVVHIHQSILFKISIIYNHFNFCRNFFPCLVSPCTLIWQDTNPCSCHQPLSYLQAMLPDVFYIYLHFSYLTNFDLYAAFRL